MNDTKDTIRRFILANYLQGELPINLRDETRLQSSGILDSLATLGVIAFVEREFGIDLFVQETGVDSFDRIEDMAALVARKQQGVGQAIQRDSAQPESAHENKQLTSAWKS